VWSRRARPPGVWSRRARPPGCVGDRPVPGDRPYRVIEPSRVIELVEITAPAFLGTWRWAATRTGNSPHQGRKRAESRGAARRNGPWGGLDGLNIRGLRSRRARPPAEHGLDGLDHPGVWAIGPFRVIEPSGGSSLSRSLPGVLWTARRGPPGRARLCSAKHRGRGARAATKSVPSGPSLRFRSPDELIYY